MKDAVATLWRRVRAVASLAPYSLLAIAELVHSQTVEHTIPRRSLRYAGPRIFVPPDVSFRYPKSIELGADVSLGAGDRIWASPNARIIIGAHALIGPNVTILSANHTFNSPHVPIRSQPEEERDVTIGEMTWIGAGAVILPGVTLGDGAIVGAGAVVTADVEPYTIVGGVPARTIGVRAIGPSQKETGG